MKTNTTSTIKRSIFSMPLQDDKYAYLKKNNT